MSADQSERVSSRELTFTEQDYFDIWSDLTKAQQDALCVLADGREHYCWKWSSDPEGQAGRGCVNAKAVGRLVAIKLARYTNYGDAFTGGKTEVTDIGQAVWDASVFDPTPLGLADLPLTTPARLSSRRTLADDVAAGLHNEPHP